MRKGMKQVLAALLALTMLFGVVGAFAEEDTEISSDELFNQMDEEADQTEDVLLDEDMDTDTDELTEEEKQIVRKQVAMYHDTYDLIRNGDLYRLVSPFDNAFRAVWEIVAEDKRRVMVTVVTMRMDYMPHTIVRLHGLDPNLIYEDEATGQRCSGALLMHAGLNLTYAANRDGASKVLLFRAVGTVEQA